MGRLKDALKPTNNWAGTSFSAMNSDIKMDESNPSRLLNNSVDLRNSLESRNLYTDVTEYPLQPNDRERIVNAVSGIMGSITPFSSTNLSNTVVGRLVSTPTTPLSDIGLLMLGKQFTLNFKSNLIQETLPTINVRNLFDGNSDTKLFQKKINYSITEKEETGIFENFIEDFFGYHPQRENPFNKNTTNAEYLQNTGVGQLDLLFGNVAGDNSGGLNKNIYKPSDFAYFEAADRSNNKIADRKSSIGFRNWFNFTSDYHKYLPIEINFDAQFNADSEMNNAYINSYQIKLNDIKNQEYAPNLDFVENFFGNTEKIKSRDLIETFLGDSFYEDDSQDGIDDNINNQLVWGRDGISDKTDERLSQLRGDVDFSSQDPNTRFNVKFGLLEYTRNLLNATEGQLVDQTRKYHKKNGRFVGANGSKLWRAPESSLSRFSGKKGIRQHSVLDQYDRFAKAIRFDGNEVYTGNEDSVVYNSVLPRIHPTLDKEGIPDNENLTFSIENLAVVAIGGDENYGIIDDEYGTQIPRFEVGPFNGRYMWFPPYGISINETATANFEPTVMIGRNEPVYTYKHSERSATLSFKMIVDYPEQLKNFIKEGNHKDVAEFFAFGGDDYTPKPFLNNAPKTENENEGTIDEIEGPKKKKKNIDELPNDYTIYFPNDVPKDDFDLGFVVDYIFNLKYEINGLNSKIFSGEGQSKFDNALHDFFVNVENAENTKIIINGGATALYIGSTKAAREYNQEISERRAKAAKKYLEQRIKKVLPGKSNEILRKLKIETNAEGARSNQYDTAESISERGAKQERSAVIQFVERENSPEDKEQKTTPQEKSDINSKKDENRRLQGTDNQQDKDSGIDTVMEERKAGEFNDDGILGGFQSVTKNKFYPAFHSQTPEDFHKRLTFLQQCTRQGSAIRSGAETDENGITRVKNSVFGRQPICIIRVGDFYYTKIIIESINIDYDDTVWDTNPEGFGMQPMIADITLQIKILGGQSLKGPIDALQNAVSFNYYANSTFSNNRTYATATREAEKQQAYMKNVLTKKEQDAQAEFNSKMNEDFLSSKNNVYGYTKDNKFE